MTFAEIILSVILSLPPAQEDQGLTLEQRTLLLKPVAEAIALVTEDKVNKLELASAQIAVGWFESKFAKYVIEGRCLEGKYKCDLDKHGQPRAYGYGQVWRWCKEAWNAVPGSRESIIGTATCVSRHWSGARLRCASAADPIAGAFAGYRGQNCNWVPAQKRAVLFRKIQSKLISLNKQK